MGTAPDDAFSVLGNETRVEILRVMAERTGRISEQETLSFSEIYDNVGIGDSGQFNYHLDKLQDHYIQQTDSGYRLSNTGWEVVWAIRAGTFRDEPEREFDAPGTCYACGDSVLRARVENGWFAVRCGACNVLLTSNPLPPAVFETRTPDEVISVYDSVVRHRAGLVADRVCLKCCGLMEATVIEDTLEEWDLEAVPRFTCAHCEYWYHPPFGLLLVNHPKVKAFFRERGVDLEEPPFWDIPVCVDPSFTTVRSRDPWRVDVTVTENGEQLRVVFDGNAAVHEIDIN